MNQAPGPQRCFFEHRNLRFSYLDSAPGEHDRPIILLLHGFPDEATMWHAQISALHAAGYRCLAPDTLGCGQSDMAATRSAYSAHSIAADHIALLNHLAIDTAQVVGHDWGAVIAWFMAGYYPDRIARLVAISVGHPTCYARAGISQKLKGWYTLYFMFAGVVERLLMGHGPLSLRRVFGSHPRMDEVLTRLAAPGRLTAALRLYRANLATILLRTHPDVTRDTLGIWSDEDAFLTESQMTRSERRVTGTWQYRRLSGGHWIPLEQADKLNALLLEQLSPGR